MESVPLVVTTNGMVNTTSESTYNESRIVETVFSIYILL